LSLKYPYLKEKLRLHKEAMEEKVQSDHEQMNLNSFS
jgi:hypothetical protein